MQTPHRIQYLDIKQKTVYKHHTNNKNSGTTYTTICRLHTDNSTQTLHIQQYTHITQKTIKRHQTHKSIQTLQKQQHIHHIDNTLFTPHRIQYTHNSIQVSHIHTKIYKRYTKNV